LSPDVVLLGEIGNSVGFRHGHEGLLQDRTSGLTAIIGHVPGGPQAFALTGRQKVDFVLHRHHVHTHRGLGVAPAAAAARRGSWLGFPGLGFCKQGPGLALVHLELIEVGLQVFHLGFELLLMLAQHQQELFQ